MEQNERAPLVPRHVRGRELGLCPELSTATMRGDLARGKKGGVESGRDAWVPRRAGGGLWPSTVAGGAPQRRRQSKQRSREVEDEGWTGL